MFNFKHTRVNDVFNFSDLVGIDKNGNTLLNGIFSEWKILKAEHRPCKVIIYSNKVGDAKVTSIFDALREQLPQIDELSEFSPPQYAADFAKLCQQLSPENSVDPLEFLKNFTLYLGQANLDSLICGIHNKLARYFKVDEKTVAGLDIRLCDALSQWTSNNVIERLNREIRRRTRVVGTFPDGNSALMLVCARLRHVATKAWGIKRYINMNHLEELGLDDPEVTVG